MSSPPRGDLASVGVPTPRVRPAEAGRAVEVRFLAPANLAAPQWTALNRQYLGELALNPLSGPLYYRLRDLAAARADNSGHAPFARGELLDLLRHGRRGVARSLAPSQMSNDLTKAIRECVKREFLAAASCSTCLVLPAALAQHGWTGELHCIHAD